MGFLRDRFQEVSQHVKRINILPKRDARLCVSRYSDRYDDILIQTVMKKGVDG